MDRVINMSSIKNSVLCLRLYLIVLALIALIVQPGIQVAQGIEVLPGQGVSFVQVDFTWSGATTLNSSTGQIDADIATLQTSTGMSSGFINVLTSSGWVVQNLPIFSDFPHTSISTNFDLGSITGVNTTSLNAFVDFSSTPVTDFTGGSPTTFPVGDIEYNAEGYGGSVSSGPPAPPPPSSITFQAGGLIEATFEPNHPHLETADNQCLPAAVATSFQWLENTYGINVPHPNVPGLGMDGSLVGQLETEMGRTSRNRNDGDPTSGNDGMRGKLRYLIKNGLTNIEVKHQGLQGGSNITETVQNQGTMTSIKQGTIVSSDFIINEIKHGEDVELGFLYAGGGGHFVEVVGAGTIFGIPWVAHQSDYDQRDDTKGTDRVDFSFLVDTDGDGQLNLVYNKDNANVAEVFSESPDTTSPITKISTSTGGNGWYKDRTIYLNATDNSSVKYTNYSIDGGTWRSNSGTGWNLSTPITLTDGIHSLQYYSSDNAGNAETTNTVSVKVDSTPPSVYPLYSYDATSGISLIGVSDVVNAIITVEGYSSRPTTPSNTPQDYSIVPSKNRVDYTRQKINSNLPASYRITATDMAGNTKTACPIFFTLPREPGQSFSYSGILLSTESKFNIDNNGVTNIRITINDHKFNLVAHPNKRNKDGNTYFIPEQGEYDIDLSSYLIPGYNSITIEARGKPSGSADIVISE